MGAETGTGIGGVVAYLPGAPGASGDSRCDPRLASLPAAGVLSSRFCAWRGASDYRYVASVYEVDRAAVDVGLPDFEGFVLMAVERGAFGRNILAVSTIERAGDRDAAVALGLALSAHEWHVHLLAEDRHARTLMAADLRGRHGDAPKARCA